MQITEGTLDLRIQVLQEQQVALKKKLNETNGALAALLELREFVNQAPSVVDKIEEFARLQEEIDRIAKATSQPVSVVEK
jgi:chaperonin cofactor prefoldin